MGWTRRQFLARATAGAAGLALAACASPAGAPGAAPGSPTARPVRPLTVGHLARQLGNLVTQYDEVGPKHGVRFDLKLFPDGRALLQALQTGDILLAAPTKVQLVQAMAAGTDLVMVLGYAGGYTVFVARRGLEVTPGDWASVRAAAAAKRARGEPFRIGVPTASLQHISLLERLAAAGIDSQRDVEVVNVPFNEHLGGIESGQLDMAGAIALFAAQGLVQEKVALFEHATRTALGRFEVGFLTTRKLARERPEDLQDVVSAHYEAMRNIVDDPTKGLAREVRYTELPETVVRRSFEFLTFDFRVDVGAIRSTERVMRDLKLHAQDLSGRIDEHVDLSFLAKASGKTARELGSW